MNEMTITSAQYVKNLPKYDGDTSMVNTSVEATINGQKMSVPLDTANRHYQAILDWVAEGNSIADAS